MSQIDIELAALLSSLSFEPAIPHAGGRMGVPATSSDDMDEDRGYQSDSTDISTSSVAQARPASPCLRCYHGGSVNAAQTIGDAELSELVFMHREAFLACPSAHTGCSASFKGLASLLERRVQQPAGGSLGMDAVGMLRTEAWLLSGWSA
ncbi:hypothetical protein BJV77DRAFT_967743 [Russula vinacea]|nr:hypothetical protein BJV77DRAFT_967743 [Russula vinacea]